MDNSATILTPGNALLAIGGPASAVVPPGTDPAAVSAFAALMTEAGGVSAENGAGRQTVAGEGTPLPVADDERDPAPDAALVMWSPPPSPPALVPQAASAPNHAEASARLPSAPAVGAPLVPNGTFEPLDLAEPQPPNLMSAAVVEPQRTFVPGTVPAAMPGSAARTSAFVPDATLAVAEPATVPRSPENRAATVIAGSPVAEHIGGQVGAPAPPTAPAAQVFAAALHRFALSREPVSDMREDDAIAPPTLGGTLLTAAPITAGAIQAPLASDTALDMTGRNWPEAMITRIEALREAHDVAAATLDLGRMDSSSARLRLAPDALGSVEVSLRRDADQVHVHIQAEQPRAQALLADAQPRLTELADARGLRLSHANTTADGGTGQQAPRQPLAHPPTTLTNRTAAADAHGDDDRIA